MNLYCVRDVVSKKWLPPWPAENDATALRTFQRSLKDHPFPGDMELFRLCDWCPECEGEPVNGVLDVEQIVFPEDGDAVEEVR